jgi:biopolymer transport protein TolQ
MSVIIDLPILKLITDASIIVQAVLALLAFVSLLSWWHIMRKMFVIRRAKFQTDECERILPFLGDPGSQDNELVQNRRRLDHAGALKRIIDAGQIEFNKTKAAYSVKGHGDTDHMVESARRAMQIAYQREMDVLEADLAFLASVGSVSPYVGLFGTVWGIMNAFVGLSNAQQTTLAAVAPGIAEALVATAVGLFAAIPAVLAYNRYTNEIDRLAVRFECGIEEFANDLQRKSR